MTHRKLLEFMRSQKLAVLSSIGADGAPQAAVIGVAVSEQLELVFDTMADTRKARNIRTDARVALVMGGLVPGDERTVQLEGLADEPAGAELERLREVYFAVFPDGRERLANWPGLTHLRVRPHWIRYSDFNTQPSEIVELSGPQLRAT